jgi:hypothetical protein
MSHVTVIVGVRCDYRGCDKQTEAMSDDFYRYPMAAGWERWIGRRRMDYCPEHAARPKSSSMHRLWPSGDTTGGDE